jgi:hypothetical protein
VMYQAGASHPSPQPSLVCPHHRGEPLQGPTGIEMEVKWDHFIGLSIPNTYGIRVACQSLYINDTSTTRLIIAIKLITQFT